MFRFYRVREREYPSKPLLLTGVFGAPFFADRIGRNSERCAERMWRVALFSWRILSS